MKEKKEQRREKMKELMDLTKEENDIRRLKERMRVTCRQKERSTQQETNKKLKVK